MEMDRWKFFWLTRRYHHIDNPTDERKLDEVIAAIHLETGERVLDIACGKAEMLSRLAERYGACGVGVDRSPYMCGEATQKVLSRGLAGRISISNLDGKDYSAPEASFAATLCVGATWVFGGLQGTLEQLGRWVRPGGTVVVGEPFWIAEPPAEYLEAAGFRRADYTDHAGNVATGEALGLTLVYAVTSSPEDWDRYYGLTWLAAYDYVRDHPEDANNAEIVRLIEKDRSAYIKHSRDCLNWGIYVFRKPLASSSPA